MMVYKFTLYLKFKREILKGIYKFATIFPIQGNLFLKSIFCAFSSQSSLYIYQKELTMLLLLYELDFILNHNFTFRMGIVGLSVGTLFNTIY